MSTKLPLLNQLSNINPSITVSIDPIEPPSFGTDPHIFKSVRINTSLNNTIYARPATRPNNPYSGSWKKNTATSLLNDGNTNTEQYSNRSNQSTRPSTMGNRKRASVIANTAANTVIHNNSNTNNNNSSESSPLYIQKARKQVSDYYASIQSATQRVSESVSQLALDDESELLLAYKQAGLTIGEIHSKLAEYTEYKSTFDRVNNTLNTLSSIDSYTAAAEFQQFIQRMKLNELTETQRLQQLEFDSIEASNESDNSRLIVDESLRDKQQNTFKVLNHYYLQLKTLIRQFNSIGPVYNNNTDNNNNNQNDYHLSISPVRSGGSDSNRSLHPFSLKDIPGLDSTGDVGEKLKLALQLGLLEAKIAIMEQEKLVTTSSTTGNNNNTSNPLTVSFELRIVRLLDTVKQLQSGKLLIESQYNKLLTERQSQSERIAQLQKKVSQYTAIEQQNLLAKQAAAAASAAAAIGPSEMDRLNHSILSLQAQLTLLENRNDELSEQLSESKSIQLQQKQSAELDHSRHSLQLQSMRTEQIRLRSLIADLLQSKAKEKNKRKEMLLQLQIQVEQMRQKLQSQAQLTAIQQSQSEHQSESESESQSQSHHNEFKLQWNDDDDNDLAAKQRDLELEAAAKLALKDSRPATANNTDITPNTDNTIQNQDNTINTINADNNTIIESPTANTTAVNPAVITTDTVAPAPAPAPVPNQSSDPTILLAQLDELRDLRETYKHLLEHHRKACEAVRVRSQLLLDRGITFDSQGKPVIIPVTVAATTVTKSDSIQSNTTSVIAAKRKKRMKSRKQQQQQKVNNATDTEPETESKPTAESRSESASPIRSESPNESKQLSAAADESESALNRLSTASALDRELRHEQRRIHESEMQAMRDHHQQSANRNKKLMFKLQSVIEELRTDKILLSDELDKATPLRAQLKRTEGELKRAAWAQKRLQDRNNLLQQKLARLIRASLHQIRSTQLHNINSADNSNLSSPTAAVRVKTGITKRKSQIQTKPISNTNTITVDNTIESTPIITIPEVKSAIETDTSESKTDSTIPIKSRSDRILTSNISELLARVDSTLAKVNESSKRAAEAKAKAEANAEAEAVIASESDSKLDDEIPTSDSTATNTTTTADTSVDSISSASAPLMAAVNEAVDTLDKAQLESAADEHDREQYQLQQQQQQQKLSQQASLLVNNPLTAEQQQFELNKSEWINKHQLRANNEGFAVNERKQIDILISLINTEIQQQLLLTSAAELLKSRKRLDRLKIDLKSKQGIFINKLLTKYNGPDEYREIENDSNNQSQSQSQPQKRSIHRGNYRHKLSSSTTGTAAEDELQLMLTELLNETREIRIEKQSKVTKSYTASNSKSINKSQPQSRKSTRVQQLKEDTADPSLLSDQSAAQSRATTAGRVINSADLLSSDDQFLSTDESETELIEQITNRAAASASNSINTGRSIDRNERVILNSDPTAIDKYYWSKHQIGSGTLTIEGHRPGTAEFNTTISADDSKNPATDNDKSVTDTSITAVAVGVNVDSSIDPNVSARHYASAYNNSHSFAARLKSMDLYVQHSLLFSTLKFKRLQRELDGTKDRNRELEKKLELNKIKLQQQQQQHQSNTILSHSNNHRAISPDRPSTTIISANTRLQAHIEYVEGELSRCITELKHSNSLLNNETNNNVLLAKYIQKLMKSTDESIQRVIHSNPEQTKLVLDYINKMGLSSNKSKSTAATIDHFPLPTTASIISPNNQFNLSIQSQSRSRSQAAAIIGGGVEGKLRGSALSVNRQQQQQQQYNFDNEESNRQSSASQQFQFNHNKSNKQSPRNRQKAAAATSTSTASASISQNSTDSAISEWKTDLESKESLIEFNYHQHRLIDGEQNSASTESIIKSLSKPPNFTRDTTEEILANIIPAIAAPIHSAAPAPVPVSASGSSLSPVPAPAPSFRTSFDPKSLSRNHYSPGSGTHIQGYTSQTAMPNDGPAARSKGRSPSRSRSPSIERTELTTSTAVNGINNNNKFPSNRVAAVIRSNSIPINSSIDAADYSASYNKFQPMHALPIQSQSQQPHQQQQQQQQSNPHHELLLAAATSALSRQLNILESKKSIETIVKEKLQIMPISNARALNSASNSSNNNNSINGSQTDRTNLKRSNNKPATPIIQSNNNNSLSASSSIVAAPGTTGPIPAHFESLIKLRKPNKPNTTKPNNNVNNPLTAWIGTNR